MMIRKGMFIGDRYEIIDKVGSGGMSDVYKAKDHKLNRFVAIKTLKSEFSDDKNFVSKFKVEAQSAAGLSHPNIVNVYDVGEDDNLYYIVMELIEGITLKKYIEKKGKLPMREAVSIAIQVAQGIEAAHNNHIIHRDIKPQNIIISREGKVKVTDFGIARAASANTINSNAMGSVHYISPEQARGGYIDEKSDIYSLGISLFEMVTGVVPFEGDSTVQIALAHIQDEMPDPRQYVADLPISVVKIIEKCTQKKSDRRYLKVSSLIADLKKALVSPDEDFVVIAPAVNNASTIMITGDEISVIRKEAEAAEAAAKAEKAGDSGLSTDENSEQDDEEDEVDEDDDEFDDDEDDSNPKLDKIVAIAAICTAIIVVIIGILIVTTLVKDCGGSDLPTESAEATTDGKTTIVPNVIDMTEEKAINTLKDANLGYRIVTEASNTIEEGHVIRISENVGSVVSKQSTILLYISKGSEPFAIPAVIGMEMDEAKTLLTGDEYGLKVEIEYKESDEDKKNKVLETSPKAPTQLSYGDKITLIVGIGVDTSDVEIPNLKNFTLQAAKDKCEELSLVLEVGEEKYDNTVSAGKIISQTPIANGNTIPRGETITVIVSKGKEPEPETTTKQPETTTEPPTTEPTTAPKTTLAASVSGQKFKEIANGLKTDSKLIYAYGYIYTDTSGNEIKTSRVGSTEFNGIDDITRDSYIIDTHAYSNVDTTKDVYVWIEVKDEDGTTSSDKIVAEIR